MILALSVVFLIYLLVLRFLDSGKSDLPDFIFKEKSEKQRKSKTAFSILIPFRNEAENLPGLLESFKKINYPAGLFELIFIDDSSEDHSSEIIKNAMAENRLKISLLRNSPISKSPKKEAITAGIASSEFDWIFTTDADCELPENLFLILDEFIGKNPEANMICGPVFYSSGTGFLSYFQQLDGLSLQGITMGSFGRNRPLMCNGANLAYKKECFEKVSGFSGNDHLPSGDDVFLMEKINRKFPETVRFLKSKEAVVKTKPLSSFKEVLHQRIRWSSKILKQKNNFSVFLGITAGLTQFLFLSLPVLAVIFPEKIWFLGSLFFLKLVTDIVFLENTAVFFNFKLNFLKTCLGIIVYPVVFLLVLAGNISGSYSWKNRNY